MKALSKESLLSVRLVAGAGTHAGTFAEIREGIYMIGRDRECQIRPKSHSVSDRHCLVQHRSGVVRAFDLDSEAGTFINNDRLPPKTWRLLNHGDRLRCGKYWFDVAIYLQDADDDIDQMRDSSGDDLLANLSPIGSAAGIAEADLFADENFNSGEFDASDTIDEASANTETHSNDDAADPATSKPKPKPKSRYSQLPKPKIKSSSASAGSSFSFGLPSGDAWKTIIAGLIMVSIVGYLGWSAYRIQKGPPIKILRGLD